MLVNGRMVEKEVVKLSDMDSHTSCQVEIVPSRIDGIVKKFTPIDLGILTVVKLGSRFVIIDGQHRRSALMELGIESAECWVYYSVPESEFGELFYEVNMKQHGCERHEQYIGAKVVTEKVLVEKVVYETANDTRTTRFNSLKDKATLGKKYLSSKNKIFKPVQHPTKTLYDVVGEVPKSLSHIFKIIDGVVFVDENKYLKWLDKNKDKIKECIDKSLEKKRDEEKAKEIEALEMESKRLAEELAEKFDTQKEVNGKYIAATNSGVNEKMGGNWTFSPTSEMERNINSNWKKLYDSYDKYLKTDSGREWKEYKQATGVSMSKKVWICTVRHEGKLLFDLACKLSYNNELHIIEAFEKSNISKEEMDLLRELDAM